MTTTAIPTERDAEVEQPVLIEGKGVGSTTTAANRADLLMKSPAASTATSRHPSVCGGMLGAPL